MNSIDLEILRRGIAGIVPEFSSWMCTSAIVCLTSQDHSSGVQLKVSVKLDEPSVRLFRVNWDTTINQEALKSYRDENRATDYGSMAIAVLLALEVTDHTYFETSQTGTGVDFWLSNDSDELNFLQARLEISGIRKASRNNSLDKRIKAKLDQTNRSDATLIPAYVAIIEFSKPESAFIKK